MWFRKEKQEPAAAAAALRETALSATPADIGFVPADGGAKVFGALVETAYPDAVATLVCFADGSTSLYLSSGGGVIGAGPHASVQQASKAFLAVVEQHLAQFAPAAGHPYPSAGCTRFYVHTLDGLLTAEAPTEDLGHGRVPLFPVFHRGHGVITAIRELGLA